MNRARRARGMALIVGLIMLALMTLMAIAAFNVGKTSLEIVGNMQTTSNVVASANDAIEEAISTIRLFNSPGSIFLTPCSAANTKCYDVNGDGIDDVTVTLTPQPQCVVAQKVLNAQLNVNNADDFGCITGTGQIFGIEGLKSGESLCANSVWEINAVAVDAVTQAKTTVTEGAAVRVSSAVVATACP